MKVSNIIAKVPTYRPRDIADTPEGFEERFDRRAPKAPPKDRLEVPERPQFAEALEKFGIRER